MGDSKGSDVLAIGAVISSMASKSSSPTGFGFLVPLVFQLVLTPSFLNKGGFEATSIQDKVALVMKDESLVGVRKRDSRFKNRLYSN
ncbi:MAG: hypothetical protein ACI9UV_003299 [Algoriphagus sp.]